MIAHDILSEIVNDATSAVFSTMLNMDVRFRGMVTDARPAATGVISLIGITGEWGGAGVFCCSATLARTIGEQMLGAPACLEPPAIDEDVLDAVAEVTNMTIGNINNNLQFLTGQLAMSVPTVIYGRNFRFRNMCGLHGAAMKFSAPGHTPEDDFEVRISLAPVSDQSAARLRIPVFGMARM